MNPRCLLAYLSQLLDLDLDLTGGDCDTSTMVVSHSLYRSQ